MSFLLETDTLKKIIPFIYLCVFVFCFFFFLIFEQAGVFLAKSKPDIFPKKNLFFVCVTNYENESNSDIVKRLS